MTLRSDPVYRAWKNMKARCRDPQARYYGAREIFYSQEWELFSNFQEDMSATYQPGLFLDRINPNQDYCKENCRWTTATDSARNTRQSKLYGKAEEIRKLYTEGVTRGELAKRFGVHRLTIRRLLAREHWK